MTNQYNEKHNLKWPYLPDHLYRMLIIGGSGSGQTNALLNLIKEQDSDNLIYKIYFYVKSLDEPKYQLLTKKREDVGTKHLNDPKAFVEHSAYMDDVCNNIDDYNPTAKRKVLIVFDDMIPDIITNKQFQAIIKELFIRCRKLNMSLVFIINYKDIDYKDFMKIYSKCTCETYSFLTIDTTLPANNSLRFRKNLLDPL